MVRESHSLSWCSIAFDGRRGQMLCWVDVALLSRVEYNDLTCASFSSEACLLIRFCGTVSTWCWCPLPQMLSIILQGGHHTQVISQKTTRSYQFHLKSTFSAKQFNLVFMRNWSIASTRYAWCSAQVTFNCAPSTLMSCIEPGKLNLIEVIWIENHAGTEKYLLITKAVAIKSGPQFL